MEYGKPRVVAEQGAVNMIIQKIYGWIPDLPDQRDYLYSSVKPKIRLPKQVDLTGFCSVVEDQSRLGSCTACALAGNLEFIDIKGITGTVPAFWGLSRLGKYTDVSRLFIYYNERALRNNEDFDSGASLRDGIKTLRKQGFCWEKNWPYLIKRFDQRPPRKCYLEAKNHLIESYYRIHTLSEMLTCLTQGYPFVFGFTVYESFESKQTEKTGRAMMPEKGERVIGGHAVLAVGYNQKEKRFLVRNSWGAKWGMCGYFTLPYEYVETLAADFWTIRK